ncbi:MAG: GNAT family N-acetyltransferase [Asgard group archaeon]|nr:GNAT family N-acetyltransferase [Asgard group archaeon]
MSTDKSNKIDLTQLVFKQIDGKKETNRFWNKYHEFNESNFKELFPNDSLPGREVIQNDFIIGWVGYHSFNWVIFEDSSEEKIIARFLYSYIKKDSPAYEKNKNNSYFFIIVKKDYRRQGIGSFILKSIVDKISQLDCLFTETDTYYDSGRNFCKKFGAKLINQQSENRLYLKNVDWDLIKSWSDEISQKNPDVSLEFFTSFPEKDIEELCTLETELYAQMPSLEEGEDKWVEIISPKSRREWEKNTKMRGQEAVTIITRESSGIISGITEIRHSNIEQIERLAQRTTGVKKEFRGKGLGKWLKAEMLLFIKKNLPNATYMVTGNADHNAPMNSINQRLGFKPYYQETSHKFILKELIKKLK